MLTRDVMTHPAVTVHTDTPVGDVAELLARHGFTAAPVVDRHQRLVGIVSEADLLDDHLLHSRPVDAPDAGQPRRVADVMTSAVVCGTPTAAVADAATLMADNRIRCLPIVDGRRVVGVITRRDLLRVIADLGETPAPAVDLHFPGLDPRTTQTQRGRT